MAALRRLNEDNLPDVLEVLEVVRTSDGAGGYTEQEQVVETYPCRAGAASVYSQEVVGPAGRLEQPLWPVDLPASARVALNQRVRVIGPDYQRVLDVVAVTGPHSYQVLLHIEGIEVSSAPEDPEEGP